VDEREVGLEPQLLGVDPVHVDVVIEGLVGEHALGALECLLERAAGGIECGIAAGDLPAGVEAEVGEDRHHRPQHLGGPAPEAAPASGAGSAGPARARRA